MADTGSRCVMYVRTRIGVRCLDICGAMSHGAPRRNRLLPTRLGTSPGVRFSASSQQGLSGCADVHEVSPHLLILFLLSGALWRNLRPHACHSCSLWILCALVVSAPCRVSKRLQIYFLFSRESGNEEETRQLWHLLRSDFSS